MEYLFIGVSLLIIAGIILILWFIFHKGPITKAAIADTKPKELVKEEKTDILLPRAKDKTSSISKKKRYYLKGLRDNAISRANDKLFPLSERPFRQFSSFSSIPSTWYWPRKRVA